MTRWASFGGGAGPAPDGGGAAPMSVDSGARFWANAFDAIMRGIPTQAVKVMRRNPNLECPVLVMVSPSFEVRFSLNCHTIVTIQSKRVRRIEENGKTFFAVRQNFFEKLADHAPIALRNNACRNQNNFLYQMRRRPRHLHRHFNRFLLSLGKCAGPRCHALLIRASALMFPTTSTKRWRSHPCQLTHGRADTETFWCQVDRFTITATNACLRLAVGTAVGPTRSAQPG